MTEWLHFHFPLSCIGEGNGNPLQCSCLENPRDRGVWWSSVFGVAQSRTRLKRLSSSSSSKLNEPTSPALQVDSGRLQSMKWQKRVRYHLATRKQQTEWNGKDLSNISVQIFQEADAEKWLRVQEIYERKHLYCYWLKMWGPLEPGTVQLWDRPNLNEGGRGRKKNWMETMKAMKFQGNFGKAIWYSSRESPRGFMCLSRMDMSYLRHVVQ